MDILIVLYGILFSLLAVSGAHGDIELGCHITVVFPVPEKTPDLLIGVVAAINASKWILTGSVGPAPAWG